jgi:hypothetical protein
MAMAKYNVLVLIDCTRLVEVEADSEAEAIDFAMDEACGSVGDDVEIGDPMRVCEVNGKAVEHNP